jgi:hypothetical protein
LTHWTIACKSTSILREIGLILLKSKRTRRPISRVRYRSIIPQ